MTHSALPDKVYSALKCLARIADAFDANELDDEARKYWGPELQYRNARSPAHVILYQGRGGKTLLTLQDCIEARSTLQQIGAK